MSENLLSIISISICTFLDSEELEKGEKIESSLEKAIVESEIYIPIFSVNYAQSSWCLKELSLMCSHISSSNSTHKMISLFYKVEPSHVRYPDGETSPYAKYFRDHSTKARHSTDTISEWKDALEKVSSLSLAGLWKKPPGKYEGKLVKQVLMDILEKLNNGSIDVAKQPVGLKERMDKKTTLSKAVCNDIKSMFDATCFLFDVRERAKESNKGVTKLQEQVLKDLLKIELKVNSVHEGKADEIYEAEELEHNQALELFSWHAFLRVCPDEGYEDLSERVVKACKGLPLSLEVMGAHLYDKKDYTTFWDEAVLRMENLMDKDLYETLKISFNGLHEEREANLFGHCLFFRGRRKTKELGISHWKASGCKNPHTAITNLSLKSLIRVEFHHFTMHDHLRDLGREIVAEESREDPCKRSRLWHPHDVQRVLRKVEVKTAPFS
eukprot:Gb_04748 [translate_table: standard]